MESQENVPSSDPVEAVPAEAKVVPEVIRIGFEAALDKGDANWRQWTPTQMEFARFFYQQGAQDTTIFINSAIANMQEGYAWIGKNISETQLPVAAQADEQASDGPVDDGQDDEPVDGGIYSDAVVNPVALDSVPTGEAAEDARIKACAPVTTEVITG